MAGKQAAPRVILIVGANRGIGYYMVKRLLELGDFISVLDIETDNLEKLKENYPNQLISITADAAKDEDIARTVGRLGQVKLSDLSSVRTIPLCENDLSGRGGTRSLHNNKQPLRKMLRGGCSRSGLWPEVPEIRGFQAKRKERQFYQNYRSFV
ncbi:MAG: SDR family NAD(P)-dependent oxidoreductase [Candidatus Limivicinus sp.]|nr:SDR family NAD(P)-dependent oxidoreductase [Candidatus Limivicinus sp.]